MKQGIFTLARMKRYTFYKPILTSCGNLIGAYRNEQQTPTTDQPWRRSRSLGYATKKARNGSKRGRPKSDCLFWALGQSGVLDTKVADIIAKKVIAKEFLGPASSTVLQWRPVWENDKNRNISAPCQTRSKNCYMISKWPLPVNEALINTGNFLVSSV